MYYRNITIIHSGDFVARFNLDRNTISEKNNKEYENLVIKSAIIGFANALYCSKFTTENDIYELKEKSYK